MLIQVILLVGICWGAYHLLLVSRHYRLLILGLAASAIAMILQPGLSMALAQILGVGRGSDLVMYVSIVVLGMLWVRTYVRLRALQQQFTLLNRHIALTSAKVAPAEMEAPPAPKIYQSAA